MCSISLWSLAYICNVQQLPGKIKHDMETKRAVGCELYLWIMKSVCTAVLQAGINSCIAVLMQKHQFVNARHVRERYPNTSMEKIELQSICRNLTLGHSHTNSINPS